MQSDAGVRTSVWMDGHDLTKGAPVSDVIEVDVCIIGGGIAGLTTAYMLQRAGKTVAVIDDGPLAGGETSRTTAHLASAIDDRFVYIEKLHGSEGARLAYESHAAAIDRIEDIVRDLNIACDFERVDGYLYNETSGEVEDLMEELEAARRSGFTDAEMVVQAPLGSFQTGPAIRFPHQAQFHPLKYLKGLTSAILNQGGKLCTGVRARKVMGGVDARVETEQGVTIRCLDVVVATNTPFIDRVAIHTKQAPYRTYVIAGPVPTGTVTRALFWDSDEPYHYTRVQPGQGQDLLIIGGEDHKTGQESHPEARHVRLEEWARKRFPMMGLVTHRWSGQVMEPMDGLAFIGRNPLDSDNVYVVTGDSGQGMTHGTIAGMLLTDLIMGWDNPWATLYAPNRKSLLAAGEYARENLNSMAQYRDWAGGDGQADVDNLRPCSGTVVREGTHHVACFKDEHGTVHRCSAVCPHLGGLVRWNELEKTWDCPVHGSRFDRHGHVVNGPAGSDLADVPHAARHEVS